MNKLPVTFSGLQHHSLYMGFSLQMSLQAQKYLCRRQQPRARGWAVLPQSIRKFLPEHTAQRGGRCSLFATYFVWTQCMRAAEGCCTLPRTGCAWIEYFCFGLNLRGKTVWGSIEMVSSSTRGTIWTGLFTQSARRKSGSYNYETMWLSR
jgi:hypothetical protein